MVQRIAELANLPQGSTEDVRRYGREADQVLASLITEFEFRGHELRGVVIALLKYCKSRGMGTGKDMNMRAARIALGYVEAGVALRIARFGVRRVYTALEKHAGQELRAMRDAKYGQGNDGKRQYERLEV